MKLKLLILLLFPVALFAQKPGYTKRFTNEEVLKFVADNAFTVPAGAATPSLNGDGQWAGHVWLDSVNHIFYFYSGGSFRAVSTGGTNRFAVATEDFSAAQDRSFNMHTTYNFTFDSINTFTIARLAQTRLIINQTTSQLFSPNGTNYLSSTNTVTTVAAGINLTVLSADSTLLTKRESYTVNLHSTFTRYSQVDRAWVDSLISGVGVTPAALTKTDDTNVTLTLGGTPSTALLQATSITVGWAGQLAVTRGGTGLATVAQGDILYGSASNTLAALTKGAAHLYLSSDGTSNNPLWEAVNLADGVSGNLAVSHLNSGTSASSSTYWRGDGTWATIGAGLGGIYGGSGSIPSNVTADLNGQTLFFAGNIIVALNDGAQTISLTSGNGVFLATTGTTLVSGAATDSVLTWNATTGRINRRNASAFSGGGGGLTTVAFGSTPNSNGGGISGATLTLQPADGSNPGGVSTTTQTIAGAKTFSSHITVDGGDAYTWTSQTFSASGDLPNTLLLGTQTKTITLFPSLGSVVVGEKLILGYWSGAARSAFEVTNVASGDGTALLMKSGGDVGIGVTAATARLHLPAGTMTAGTAPLKFDVGLLVATEEDGALEYDGNHIYMTIGATRYQLDQQSGGGGWGTTGTIATLTGASVVDLAGNNLQFQNGSSVPLFIAGNGLGLEFTPNDGTVASSFILNADGVGTNVNFQLSSNDGVANQVSITGDGIASSLTYTADVQTMNFTNIFSVTGASGSNGIVISDPGFQSQMFSGDGTAQSQVSTISDLIGGDVRFRLRTEDGSNPEVDITGDGIAQTITLTAANGMIVPHIVGGGNNPTIAAGAGAGTSPTVTVTGTDEAGYIEITSGTLPTVAASIATVTFDAAYASTPRTVLLTPANSATALLTGVTMVYVPQSTISTTTFDLFAGTSGLTGVTSYKFFYTVIQ